MNTPNKPLVIITGASSGIGLATARLFSAHGHPLLLLARRLEPMQALNLPHTLTRSVDVTDRQALAAAVQEAEARFGPADAIVNNAGVMLLGDITRQDPEEWSRMLDVNIKGVLNGVHAVQDALDVHVQHAAPFFRILARDVAQQHDARVVDDGVGGAETRLGFLNRCRQRLAVGHVHGTRQRVGQVQRLHGFQPAGQQQQRMAVGREEAGGGQADAGTGAGDDDERLVRGVHGGAPGIGFWYVKRLEIILGRDVSPEKWFILFAAIGKTYG